MTDIEKRIFIAERVLTPEAFSFISRAAETWKTWEAAFEFTKDRFKTDYPNDRNAMAQAVSTLKVNQWGPYLDALDKICVPVHICPTTHSMAIIEATAGQRADAFIAVMKGE